MSELKRNDVVQFNENHKWCGSLGFVVEIKECGERYIRGRLKFDDQPNPAPFPSAIVIFT